MISVSDYSQNFLVGSFISGIHRLVGFTTGTLYIVKPTGYPVQGHPIGFEDTSLSKPEFDLDRNLIMTRHIKVKWMKKSIVVDILFLNSNFDEDKIKAWAKMQGYREIQVVLSDEVQLLDETINNER